MKPKLANRENIEYFLLLFLYRLILDIIYQDIISTDFAYEGFYIEWYPFTYAFSWIVLVLFGLVIRKAFINNKHKISLEIMFIIFLIYFIPFTTMLGYGGVNILLTGLNLLYWSLLVVLLLYVRLFKTQINLKDGKVSLTGETDIKLIAIIFCLVVLYISGFYTGFRIHFDLTTVYELRAEASLYNLPVLISYLFSGAKYANPILIAYFIKKRDFSWGTLCFFVQILNFGVDGSKSTFFLAFFSVVITLLPAFSINTLNKLILRSGVVSLGLCLAVACLLDNIWPVSLLVRRMMFTPVKLSANYVDFFLQQTPDYFRQSFLRHFGFESPYTNIAYMIGEVYSNKVTGANSGLIADAIANLGIFGVFIFPFLLWLILRLLDRCTGEIDFRIYIVTALAIATTLINSFLFTVLLTHGLLISMIVLSRIRKTGI